MIDTVETISNRHAEIRVFPSMHSTAERERLNYTTCKLCRGEMLFDSCSKVCPRERCRQVLMFLARQAEDYRLKFWQRFDAAPRQAHPIKLWDLEQLMQEAIQELAERAA